jgi:ribosomal protein S1
VGRGGRPQKPAPKVKVGDTVKAKVQRTTPYGAFLDLEDGTSALLHVSQMANPEGLADPQPRALLSEGQELEVR